MQDFSQATIKIQRNKPQDIVDNQNLTQYIDLVAIWWRAVRAKEGASGTRGDHGGLHFTLLHLKD